MDFTQVTNQEIEQVPLIDADQWQRLSSELGVSTLKEFAHEYLLEVHTEWLSSPMNVLTMPEASFRSAAHRSAGVGGTLGFLRLRCVFLCMEQQAFGPKTQHFYELMRLIWENTRVWVNQQSE